MDNLKDILLGFSDDSLDKSAKKLIADWPAQPTALQILVASGLIVGALQIEV